MPSEVTPARRGLPAATHSESSALTKKGLPAKSIIGFGFSKWRLAVKWLFSRARAGLVRHAPPAAAARRAHFHVIGRSTQKHFPFAGPRDHFGKSLMSRV